jgi:hypothetical protein
MKKDELKELFKELLSNTRETRSEDDRRRPHQEDSIEWIQMVNTMNQQVTERRLKLEKKFGKPRSKYHR